MRGIARRSREAPLGLTKGLPISQISTSLPPKLISSITCIFCKQILFSPMKCALCDANICKICLPNSQIALDYNSRHSTSKCYNCKHITQFEDWSLELVWITTIEFKCSTCGESMAYPKFTTHECLLRDMKIKTEESLTNTTNNCSDIYRNNISDDTPPPNTNTNIKHPLEKSRVLHTNTNSNSNIYIREKVESESRYIPPNPPGFLSKIRGRMDLKKDRGVMGESYKLCSGCKTELAPHQMSTHNCVTVLEHQLFTTKQLFQKHTEETTQIIDAKDSEIKTLKGEMRKKELHVGRVNLLKKAADEIIKRKLRFRAWIMLLMLLSVPCYFMLFFSSIEDLVIQGEAGHSYSFENYSNYSNYSKYSKYLVLDENEVKKGRKEEPNGLVHYQNIQSFSPRRGSRMNTINNNTIESKILIVNKPPKEASSSLLYSAEIGEGKFKWIGISLQMMLISLIPWCMDAFLKYSRIYYILIIIYQIIGIFWSLTIFTSILKITIMIPLQLTILFHLFYYKFSKYHSSTLQIKTLLFCATYFLLILFGTIFIISFGGYFHILFSDSYIAYAFGTHILHSFVLSLASLLCKGKGNYFILRIIIIPLSLWASISFMIFMDLD